MNVRHLLTLTAILASCGGESLHLGNDDPAAGSGASGGDGGTSGNAGPRVSVGLPFSSFPPQEGCGTDPALQPLLGTWQGQLEDFFLNQVDTIRLVIDGANAAGICGSVTWGSLPPLPAAEDPDAHYPPEEYWQSEGWGGGPPVVRVPGVPYTIVSAAARLPMVRFGVLPTEPWRSWCELQTPVADPYSTNGWGCLGMDPVSTSSDVPGTCEVRTPSGDTKNVPEMRCLGCFFSNSVCDCNETGCVSRSVQEQPFELALAEDGNSLSGAFEPLRPWAEEVLHLYLERVQPNP